MQPFSGVPGVPSGFYVPTPSDTLPLPAKAIALFVGVAGNVAIVGMDGTAVTVAVPAGAYLLGPINQVKATGTTASGLLAYY